MDFFAQQDHARKNTGILLSYFGMAIVGTILLVYFFPVLCLYIAREYTASPTAPPLEWWNPLFFVGVCGITLLVVVGGTLFKIAQLRQGGGEGVASMLGGRQI